MQKAIAKIDLPYEQIIIDGNFNFLPAYKNVLVKVKADQLFAPVSAASIIAKVYRDDWMRRLALSYPEYGFEKHVGYGTKLHLEQIKKYGPCPLHRMFYKPLIGLAANPATAA